METIITKKGQVVIPAVIRKKYQIKSGMKIQWIDMGSTIQLIPIPLDPIAALKGCAEGEKLTAMLLENRRKDQSRE